MIYCPKCGAANRDASKFCNECGAKLPSASGMRCPMCGKINALGNVYCDSCSARLVPMTAQTPAQESPPEPVVPIKRGLSLPTKPRGEDGEVSDEMPDWLVRMRQTIPGETAPEPEPEELVPEAPDWTRLGAAEEPQVEESPDWLRDLRRTTMKKPGTEPVRQDQPAEVEPGEEIPDWLRGAAPVEPEAEPAEEMLDWLRGAAPVEPEAEPAEEIPDWLRGAAPVEAMEPEAEPVEEIPDWLRGAAPVEPEAEPAEEIPNWLRGAAPVEPEAEPAEEIPNWLRGAAPVEPEAEPAEEMLDWLRGAAPVEPEAEPAEEIPDWLRGAAPAEAVEPEAEPAEEIPDWLRGAAPVEPEAEPAEEIPDWLRGAAPAEAVVFETEPVEEIPDWLLDVGGPPTDEVEPAEQAEPAEPPALEAAELPDWLKDMAPPTGLPEGHEPAENVTPPAPAELPSWLKDMAPPQVKPLETAPSPTRTSTKPLGTLEDVDLLSAGIEEGVPDVTPLAPAELPDWLREMKASMPPGVTGQPAAKGTPFVGEEASGLAQATIPAWLEAMRPREHVPSDAGIVEEEMGQEETEGILAGLRDVLPLASIVERSQGGGISLQFDVPASDISRAGIFNEVLTRGVGAMIRRGGETRAQKLWGRTQRLIIFAVILLAVLAPLVGPQAPAVHNAISWFVGQPVPSKDGNKFLQQVDGLQPGSTVLVVFDYDPTQAGEMDMMARAVFAHVLSRQARILAVSLYPVGPATAQAVWEDLARKVTDDQGQPFVYGTHFVNLGYVPGQATGAQLVSSLKFDQVVQTDFTGLTLTGDARPALLQTVNSIQDVGLIVDLAASPDNVRWWIEQLAIYPAAPPLVAGVSAAAAPMVRPYLSSNRINQPDVSQLVGLIDGMPDALAYPQAPLQGQVGNTLLVRTGMFEALSLASAALIILIVVGNIGQQVARLRRRR